MRFTGGYIKMHRSFLEWEWYTDLNTRVLFQHMILIANYKDTRLRGKEVKRGQIVTSIKELSNSSGISVQSVRTSLDKLKLTNEITIESTSEGSTITVNNYNLYQDINEQTNKPPTNEQQATNKRLTTYKESKKGKEVKNIEERKKDFATQVKQFLDKYDKEMLKAFYEYWSEHGPNDKKMRFEKQTSFGVSRRLSTWKLKQAEFTKPKNGNTQEPSGVHATKNIQWL